MKRPTFLHVIGGTGCRIASWDHWLDEERQAHLYRIPAQGGEIQAITLPTGWELPRSSQGTGSYDVAPDESLVAFLADSKRDGVAPDMDIFLVAPVSDQAWNITEENEASDSSPLFSPDGRYLAYNKQYIKGFYGDTRRLVLYDVNTGSHTEITLPTGTVPPTGWSGHPMCRVCMVQSTMREHRGCTIYPSTELRRVPLPPIPIIRL
jgi:hypothetical protein